MMFWLGTHEPAWLAHHDVPFMVSRNRLARQPRWRRAQGPWVLDSGGFTELQHHGGWRISANRYAADVARYASEIGNMAWAAPQDWMCEPAIIHGAKGFVGTGLTVAEHQARTVGNYVELRSTGVAVIPVLQGFTLGEYETCVRLYDEAGIDLTAEPLVGLGSVCRRQATDEIHQIVSRLHGFGIRLHGFGCKEGALRAVGHQLASADSMAWSLGGRKRGTCTHLKSRCSNHLHWALEWRESVLASLGEATPTQAQLFY